jgi:hypothetical protein
MNRFDLLPYDLQLYIYEFDPHYRQMFQPTINEFKIVEEIMKRVDYVVYMNAMFGVMPFRKLRGLVRQFRKRHLRLACKIYRVKPCHRLKRLTKRTLVVNLCMYYEWRNFIHLYDMDEHISDFLMMA